MLHFANAIREDGASARPVLRIAVPSWRPRSLVATGSERSLPRREDFKRLLDSALDNSERIHCKMTRAERKQLAVSRKIREALYKTSESG